MQVSEVIWWNWDAALQGLQTIATVMYTLDCTSQKGHMQE